MPRAAPVPGVIHARAPALTFLLPARSSYISLLPFCCKIMDYFFFLYGMCEEFRGGSLVHKNALFTALGKLFLLPQDFCTLQLQSSVLKTALFGFSLLFLFYNIQAIPSSFCSV